MRFDGAYEDGIFIFNSLNGSTMYKDVQTGDVSAVDPFPIGPFFSDVVLKFYGMHKPCYPGPGASNCSNIPWVGSLIRVITETPAFIDVQWDDYRPERSVRNVGVRITM
jgi:hypothetical protein